MRNAPIASDTPSSSPSPPNASASPKKTIVKSSSSRVPMSREMSFPPYRAIANIATRNANAVASCTTMGQTSVSPLSTTDTIAR